MTFLKSYFINTTDEVDVLNVSNDVKFAIRDSGGKDGLATVIISGPGAGVTLLEPLPEVIEELKVAFEVFAGEGAAAKDKKKKEIYVNPRVQAAILGRSISVPIKDALLVLDPYEEIFLVDFDKKMRRREFKVQIMAQAESQPQQSKGAPPPKKK
ncbi:MAG: hypothetical protein COV46_07170 [Deltaproteobacteria bacterium CG11_big_fil_rev_8_21_14_0_20_49_13]|nr:MAG: hypothetical protein COV46_07170 [Deltaproteobacteria bacterium CG11_big_fil_rev_8_21_14_0_20_49_13]